MPSDSVPVDKLAHAPGNGEAQAAPADAREAQAQAAPADAREAHSRLAPTHAREAQARLSPEYAREARDLAATPIVRSAFDIIEGLDDWAMDLLAELTEIPAPPFKEAARGCRFAELLTESGADPVWTDAEGNVLGLRRGQRGDRTIACGAHLDTVFPEGTDVTVRRRGDTLHAPGVGDNTRGLVVLLVVLRALEEARLKTNDDLLFVGVVGEEGLGDLRGMKHIYRDPDAAPEAWVEIDGDGFAGVVVDGLGSVRHRITFQGRGGHSWRDFGLANPVHAMSRAVSHFQDAADSMTRRHPRTSYNVGRIGGGTSVNAVPAECWMEVDMRSISPESLARLEAALLAAVDRACDEENELRRAGPALAVRKLKIGDRPSGEGDRDAPLVQRALAATEVFGAEATLGRSSTDSNIPIALGVPAVTIGRGGICFDAHSTNEYWTNLRGHTAIQRALLLLVAEAGMATP